jgi:Domain of unknown function (DUF4091)
MSTGSELSSAVPGGVSLVGSLSLSPSPVVGSPVTVTFTVRNTGGEPVPITYLLAGARTSSGANVDFPPSSATTLAPGEQQVYNESRAFNAPGDYTVWPAWFDGTNYYQLAPATAFTVAASTSQNVVVVDPNLKVLPTASVSGAAAASMVGSRNEVLSFQIVVPASESPLAALTAAVAGPLSGPSLIAAENIRLYRVSYYVVKEGQQTGPDSPAAGRWPDPLVPDTDAFYGQPRNAFPVDIPAGENRVVWVDVLIPEQAEPGDYTGSVQVSTSAWTEVVQIKLHVIGFTLPSTTTLRSSFSVNSEQIGTVLTEGSCWNSAGATEACWEANEAFLACGLDHRITLANAWLQDPDQNPQAFHDHLRPYLDGSGGKTLLQKAQMTTVEYDPAHISGWRQAVEPLATGAEAFVYFRGHDVCDEIYLDTSQPPPQACPATWQDSCWPMIQAVLGSWHGGNIQMTTDIQTSDTCGMAAEINGAGGRIIIIPVIDHMEGKPGEEGPYPGSQRGKYEQIIANGNELWLYTSCDSWGCNDPIYSGWASYAIDASGSQNRSMGWLCFLYRVTGELYYQVTESFDTAWNVGGQWKNGGNGDGNLFYPGLPTQPTGNGQPPLGGTDPIPIESIRLKLIRAGRQDYEYLHYLAQNGQETQAQSIASGLFKNAYSTIRPNDDVESARRSLVSAVEALITS